MRMFTTRRNIKKQSGASIVLAVFLMVILGLMGAGMVSLLTTSQQSISQELTSAKAYMAGRSCLQWAMYQSVYSPVTVSTTYKQLPGFDNLNSALYNSQCEVRVEPINVDDIKYYNIMSEATFSTIASPEYSKRTLLLQFQILP